MIDHIITPFPFEKKFLFTNTFLNERHDISDKTRRKKNRKVITITTKGEKKCDNKEKRKKEKIYIDKMKTVFCI